MYRLESIFIYPIKSFAGISLQSSLALTAGFEYDRRWMLISPDNRFISQREHPRLALFKVEINAENLCIAYEGDQVGVHLDLCFGDDILATVWDDQAVVNVVNREVSAWLSERIGADVRLVKLKDESARIHFSSKLSEDIPVSLADGYPYLVLSPKSLEHLNAQLEAPVLMNRFRPNIVITTTSAHEEDEIECLSFGKVQFKNIRPCGRCVLINTDQELATVGKEPLRTLSTYRRQNNSVVFGSNFVCTTPGIVEVGMISGDR